MIDFILSFVLLAILFFIYTVISFFLFRKRLLKEFMSRGLSFDQADNVYTQYSEIINKMKFEKVPVSKIVDEIINKD
jgi:hypothetical protein